MEIDFFGDSSVLRSDAVCTSGEIYFVAEYSSTSMLRARVGGACQLVWGGHWIWSGQVTAGSGSDSGTGTGLD